MTILFYLVLGLAAGALAKFILPGRQGGGIIATIVLGVIGALVGGLLGNLVVGNGFTFEMQGNWLVSLITAVVGSIIVLLVYGQIAKRS